MQSQHGDIFFEEDMHDILSQMHLFWNHQVQAKHQTQQTEERRGGERGKTRGVAVQ